MPPAPNNNAGQHNMQRPLQTAFDGAPATKLLAAVTLLSYMIIHSKHAHDLMAFDSNKLLSSSTYGSNSSNTYRYWTSKLTFGTMGELVTGGLLFAFLARKMEREMGSRKFLVFYVLMTAASIAMEVLLVHTGLDLLLLLDQKAWQFKYAGPYAFTGALFFLFHKYTPRLHPRFFGVAGFYFSEKSFYYLWFLQVVTAARWSSVVATATGAMAAAVYTNSTVAAWSKLVDVPDSVAALSSKLGERVLLQEPPRMLVSSGAGGAARGGGGAGAGGAGRAGAAPAPHPIFGQAPRMHQQMLPAVHQRNNQQPQPQLPPPPPDEAAIEQLVLMGFPRASVIEALQFANNDVNRAADRLLTQL
jgi:hypothetical protein